jgi:DNA-directed RNA polymerase specialized sigma24 family protein
VKAGAFRRDGPLAGWVWRTAALRALSTRQRTMVFLRFYADLTYDEIAVALDVRPGTVAATLHQSTEFLRRLLGAQGVAK